MHRFWVKPISFDVEPGRPVVLEGPLDAMTFLRLEWTEPLTETWVHAMEACEACLDEETETAEPSYAPVIRALASAGISVKK